MVEISLTPLSFDSTPELGSVLRPAAAACGREGQSVHTACETQDGNNHSLGLSLSVPVTEQQQQSQTCPDPTTSGVHASQSW